MNLEPTPTLIRQRPLRDLLDEALRMSRHSFLRILPSVAVPLSVAALVMSVGQLLFTMGAGNPATMSSPHTFGISIGLFFGGFGLYLLASAICNTALLGATVWQALGQPQSMGAAWRWALRPAVLGTSLLVVLVVMAGMVMCIVPGFVLGILFGLTLIVSAAEGKFGPAAMGRSRALISHNPQGKIASHPGAKLFIIGFVGYLITYLTSLLVQAPFALVQQILMVRSMTSEEATGVYGVSPLVLGLQVPQAILGTFATEAVVMYMVFASTLLYIDLRGTKEGQDLVSEMDLLGAPGLGADHNLS